MIKTKNFQELGMIPPSLIVPTTGNYFFVDSNTGSDANSGVSPRYPFKTLDYAIGRCTANKGDVIYVMPGHSETLSSASAITSDVAGVSVIGLGNGSNRPTFLWGAANATWVVSANNLLFKNCVFTANYADVAMMFDVSGIDGLTFEDCLFNEAGTNLNFIIVIDLATGGTNLTIRRCQCFGNDAENDSFINAVAWSGLFMYDSIVYFTTAQTAAAGLLDSSGNMTRVDISNCRFVSLIDDAEFIDFNGSANTGCISYCHFSSLDTAGAVTACIDFTGGHVFECYVAGEADSYGIVGGGTAYDNS